MNWRDGELNSKILQHSATLFSRVSTTPPRRRSENRAENFAFKHRIRSIWLYRHCNALHFGNKHTVRYAVIITRITLFPFRAPLAVLYLVCSKVDAGRMMCSFPDLGVQSFVAYSN